MVELTFAQRFVEPIRRGHKFQAFIAPNEHIEHRVGPKTLLELMTAQRLIIRLAHCEALTPITLTLSTGNIETKISPPTNGDIRELNAYAKLDGFDDWADLVAFSRAAHPGIDTFRGWLIRWSYPTLKGMH